MSDETDKVRKILEDEAKKPKAHRFRAFIFTKDDRMISTTLRDDEGRQVVNPKLEHVNLGLYERIKKALGSS